MFRNPGNGPKRVLICLSNRAMATMAQLQARRHGIDLEAAQNGRELVAKALLEPKPLVIVLSPDLKNPTTEETMKLLNADPRLRGIEVVVIKGAKDLLASLLKRGGLPRFGP